MTGVYQIDTGKYKINGNNFVIAQFSLNSYSSSLIGCPLSAGANGDTGLVSLTARDKNGGFPGGITSTISVRIIIINNQPIPVIKKHSI